MNCPKCGSFIEEGKEYCFMCGTKIGSGEFQSPGRSDENPSLNEEYYRKKEEYKNRLRNYRDVEVKRADNEKKDIFDIYAEHNVLFKTVVLLIIVGVGFFIFFKIKTNQTKLAEKQGVANDLYYEVSSLMSKSGDGNVYSLSNGVGADCSIRVLYEASTSKDFKEDLYKIVEQEYVPQYDDKGNLEVGTQVPLYQKGELQINGTSWYYINVLFKANEGDNYTFLKHKYLATTKNGFGYTIILTNNTIVSLNSRANENPNYFKCVHILDGFTRSLEFVK